MRNEVIYEVISLRRSELEGQVAAFENTYAAYDPDPDNEAEEGRLVYIIDEGMSVLEQLGQPIAKVRAEPETGLRAWPPCVSLLYRGTQAMTERERTCGAEEITGFLPTVDEALNRVQGIETYPRDMSDARFGPVLSRRHTDFAASVVGYMFGHFSYSALMRVIAVSWRKPTRQAVFTWIPLSPVARAFPRRSKPLLTSRQRSTI